MEENGFTTIDASQKIEISKKHLNPIPVVIPTAIAKTEQKVVPEPVKDPVAPEGSFEERLNKRMKKVFADLPFQVAPQQQKEMVDQMMNLLLQMGSSQMFLGKGQIDNRKLASLNQHDLLALGHFNYRGNVDHIRYFKEFVIWILTASVSVDNLRSRQFIQLASAMGGGSQQDIVKKPGLIGRLRNPNWRRDAEDKGAIIVE